MIVAAGPNTSVSCTALPLASAARIKVGATNADFVRIDTIDFVHPSLKPAGDCTKVSEFRRDGDTVYSDGWWMNAKLNTFMQSLWPDLDRADIYNFVRWNAPSHVLLHAGLKPADGSDGDGPLGPAAHFFTPETASSTHYFWMVSRKATLEDETINSFLKATGGQAFEMEDRPMIESQQTNLAGRGFDDMRPVSFSSDGGALLARRILAQKIAQEAQP